MRIILPILLVVLFFGCEQKTSPTTEPSQAEETKDAEQQMAAKTYPFTFSKDHFGKIKPGMSAEEVTAIYGAENFVFDTLYGPEGITYPGYRLFPGKDAEAEVTFPEAGEEDNGISIQIRRTGSPWRDIDSGIGMGTSLEELVRLNGRAVKFYGFGWDYGLLVTGQKGGGLNEAYGFSLEAAGGMMGDKRLEKFYGDIEISSDEPLMEEMMVSVRQLRISL